MVNTETAGFIRIVNSKRVKDGNAIHIEPVEDRGAKIVIDVDDDLQLERVFQNTKRPKLAIQAAEALASRMPPRTTTHCLIVEYGFDFPESADKSLLEHRGYTH